MGRGGLLPFAAAVAVGALTIPGSPLRASPPPAAVVPVESHAADSAERVHRELAVPLVRQTGDITNCGPTAAAMMIAAYQGVTAARELEQLRDRLGNWSWSTFPLRRFALPGYDPGMSTPAMLQSTLNRFGKGVHFRRIDHGWLPPEGHAMATLKRLVAEGRPVLALVQAHVLWGTSSPGLHWVVVRGVSDTEVAYNDPADERRYLVPITTFWQAWRLDPFFRELPAMGSFSALVGDRPLPTVAAVHAADLSGD